MADDKQDEGKQFSLKDIEVQMINGMQQRAQAEVANFLSFIALERLAYDVTQQTQFRIDGNKLTITELTVEDVDSAVSTGDKPTKDAIGAK